MKKIQMVDVVSQYERYKSEIDASILSVLKSGIYIQGPEVKKFELLLSNYLHSKYTISCANGTDALYLALRSLNLQPGDEVIVPAFTFVSTVEAVCLLGLKPIFIDIDSDTFLLNPNLIKDVLTNRTRAILPVHLFGQCCDMVLIQEIANQHNLFVIEDAAQSIGAKCHINSKSLTKKFSGTIGHIGITSFYPSKNLGCFGDGGAIFTQDQKISQQIRLLANHGQKQKYYHDIIGLNSRLDAVQASILSFKLSLLDHFNKKRNKVAEFYNKYFNDVSWIKTPVKRDDSDHVYHQYSIILSSKIDREKLQSYLFKKGIPTMIYYPIPLHKQKAYRHYSNQSLPIAEKVSKQIISLPIHPEMDLQQMEFIGKKIKNYI